MKGKTQQQTTNTYGFQSPPSWGGLEDFDKSISEAYDTADPSIPYTFANMRNNVNSRLSNPFGPNYSPEVADAMKYSETQNIDQMQGQAMREDSFNRKNAKVTAKATKAGMTAPILTQTGGSMTGSQTTPWGPAVIGAVGAVGAGAMG